MGVGGGNHHKVRISLLFIAALMNIFRDATVGQSTGLLSLTESSSTLL